MKVTVDRAELLSAAKRAARVARSTAPIDILKCVLVEADSEDGKLTLSATNMETALEQKVVCSSADNDTIAINAKLLEEMLALMEGSTVDFQREEKEPQVTVRSGQAIFTIPVMEGGAFPKVEIPFPEDTVQVSGIPTMARRSVFATGQDPEKPMLKCVNLRFTKDGLRAVGSDGNCMVSARGDNKSVGDTDLLVPASSMTELAHMCEDKETFRVGSTGKQIVFFRENFAYSARLVNGEYINVDGVLAAMVNSFTVLTDVAELKRALRAVTALSPENMVRISFSGNRLEFGLRDESGDSSTAIEVIPLTGMPQGDYWFSGGQLFSCLQALAGTVTLGIAQSGMLTISTDDALYMQTGMRPQSAKEKKQAKIPAKKAA